MSCRIVVMIKQVPDTQNVGPHAMNADGTVNRAALPAIFNPEDLKALEMALQVKERIPETEVIVLTMGPDRAASIVRESLSRGADRGIIISDRRFAGSDTLATSYALSCAIRKIGHVDLVMGGRQAIDGDTAQVGPQVAEKLGWPQVTYAETLLDIDQQTIRLTRRLDNGVETVESSLPALVTVTASAQDCRYPHAHRLLQYYKAQPEIWDADAIEPEPERLGMSGSPTKVKKIDSVSLAHKEGCRVDDTPEAINDMVATLIREHIIG
ncbi:MAG: electron transfer flavoprotein subunit beta/FixA family protein [Bacteroidales bacterium]|nr:electron transfer flavoprotein subunit beta/FixA family protein [Bacteroidales bacterium]